MPVFGRWKPLFALKPLHVDAVFADFRPKGARIEAEEFGGAVPPGDFAVGAVERLNDVADGDLVECLEWFCMALFAVRLLPPFGGGASNARSPECSERIFRKLSVKTGWRQEQTSRCSCV